MRRDQTGLILILLSNILNITSVDTAHNKPDSQTLTCSPAETQDSWLGSEPHSLCLSEQITTCKRPCKRGQQGEKCRAKHCREICPVPTRVMVVKHSVITVNLTPGGDGCCRGEGGVEYSVQYGSHTIAGVCNGRGGECQCRRHGCEVTVNCTVPMRNLSLTHLWEHNESPSNMTVTVTLTKPSTTTITNTSIHQSYMHCDVTSKRCSNLTLNDYRLQCDTSGGRANFLGCNCEAKHSTKPVLRARKSVTSDWYSTPENVIEQIITHLQTSGDSYRVILPHPELGVVRTSDGIALFSAETFKPHILRFADQHMTCSMFCNGGEEERGGKGECREEKEEETATKDGGGGRREKGRKRKGRKRQRVKHTQARRNRGR